MTLRIDKDSLTWRELEKHTSDRLSHLRKQLEGDLTHEQTQVIRGRIRELNDLLKAANPKTPPETYT